MARLITIALLLTCLSADAQIDSSKWSLGIFLGGSAYAPVESATELSLFQTSSIGLIGGAGLGYHTKSHWNFYFKAYLQEYDVSNAVITDLTNQFVRQEGYFLIDELNGQGTYTISHVVGGIGRSWFFPNFELEPVLSFGMSETTVSANYNWKTKQMGSNYQKEHRFEYKDKNSSLVGRFHLASHTTVLEQWKSHWQLGVQLGCSFQAMEISGNLMQKDILGASSTTNIASDDYGILFFLGIGGRVRF